MVRNESAGEETFPEWHLLSWHPVSLTFDNRMAFHCKYEYCFCIIIIIIIIIICYPLDYGHLTYSSVQCFPFIYLFVAPITI